MFSFLLILVLIIGGLMLIGSVLTPWWATQATAGLVAGVGGAIGGLISGAFGLFTGLASAGIAVIGAIFTVLVGVPLAVIGGLLAVVLGLVPLVVPVLLLVGLVWLIVRVGNSASRVLPAPPATVATLPPPAPV
ncbi:MAG: hypothetical protein ACT4NL_08065 [Pseudomarimonas sp.]